MDVNNEAIKAAAIIVLGFVWQHTRANDKFPNALGWGVFAVACVGAWLWSTPGWYAGDWRATLLGLYMFVMAARGQAAGWKDARLAPPSA